MRFAGTQTIYPCEEHGDVAVPIADLFASPGILDIYPEVAGRGYFDIDFRKGELVLKAKRHVGLIPISDRVSIHVTPSAPIANLLFMIWRAGDKLPTIEGFVRGYIDHPGAAENVEELYVSTFLNALREMKARGVLKTYLAAETEEKRGRLLLNRTVSRYHSRGLRHRHVFQVHDLTADNLENRVLKHTTERLAAHFNRHPDAENRKVAAELREIVAMLHGVDSARVTPLAVARHVERLIRGLPRSHRFYEPALWLSFLIAAKSGVTMEHVGRAQFESVILDVSGVFERYVRTLLAEAAETHFGGCRVLDGNLKTVPLFVTTGGYDTKPDYYFQRARTNLAVADAKYKKKIDADDRFALIAYCQALGVSRAAIVCPRFNDAPLFVKQGTTRGGIEINVVRIDLGADDLADEEERFKSQMRDALGLSAAP